MSTMAGIVSAAGARRSPGCAAQLGVEAREPFGRADVDPAAGVALGGHASVRRGRAEERAERSARSRRDVAEERGPVNADAAERELFPAVVRDAIPGEREVAGRMVRRIVDEDEVRVRVGAGRAAQVAERVVRMEISVHYEERRVTEEAERVRDAACGLERVT